MGWGRRPPLIPVRPDHGFGGNTGEDFASPVPVGDAVVRIQHNGRYRIAFDDLRRAVGIDGGKILPLGKHRYTA